MRLPFTLKKGFKIKLFEGIYLPVRGPEFRGHYMRCI